MKNKKPGTTNVVIWLPKGLWDIAKKHAKLEGITLDAFIVQLMAKKIRS